MQKLNHRRILKIIHGVQNAATSKVPPFNRSIVFISYLGEHKCHLKLENRMKLIINGLIVLF